MYLIYSLLLVLSLSYFVKVKFKINDYYIPLIVLSSVGIILFLFGLVDQMKLGYYIIILLGIFSFFYLIYLLLKRKLAVKDLVSLPIFFFVILEVILYALLINTHYSNWDEFAHWGPNLKAMVHYDLLWANKVWTGNHISYPPFVGIIEYFFCKLNGGFSESVSYFGINSLIISALLPILASIKKSKSIIIKGLVSYFIIYILMNVFGFSIASIYIDFILGVFFFIGIYIASLKESKEQKILLPIILFCLPIIKDTGLIFSAIILLQLGIKRVVYKIIEKKKIDKKILLNLLYLILLLVVTFSGYGLWKAYCSKNGVHVDFQHDANNIETLNIKDYLKSITYVKAPTGKLKDITTTFYNALNDDGSGVIAKGLVRSAIGLLVIFLIIMLIEYNKAKTKEEKRRIISVMLSYSVGFIIYALFMLCIYLFALPEHEGRRLASYSRYMSTYFIAGFIFILAYLIEKKNKNLIIIFMLVAFLSTNVISYLNPVPNKQVIISDEIVQTGKFLQTKIKDSERVYVIYQNTDGYEFNLLRFQIAPIRTNLLWEWSLGKPYSETDYFTYNISKDYWEKKLIKEGYDYVYFAKVDKQFVDKYGSSFNGKTPKELQNSLYKVKKSKNHVIFKYIDKVEVKK